MDTAPVKKIPIAKKVTSPGSKLNSDLKGVEHSGTNKASP